jgi:hypothetical protein
MGAMYLSGSEETASLWAKLGHVGLIFFPTAAYHFTLRVLDRRTRDPILLTGIAGSLFFLPALASDAFLREFQLYGWGYYFGYGPLGTTFVLFFALMLGACMLRYVLALRATKPGAACTTARVCCSRRSPSAASAASTSSPPIAFRCPARVSRDRGPLQHHDLRDPGDIVWSTSPSLVGGQILETMTDALLVLDTRRRHPPRQRGGVRAARAHARRPRRHACVALPRRRHAGVEHGHSAGR